MSKYVRKFVDNCITCMLSKPPTGKVQAELHPIPKVSVPFHTVLRGHISARVLTRTWAEEEASDVQAPFAGISYAVFGS